MNRDIELIAIRVFELQKLCRDAAGLQGRQAEVPANAILSVHDRRSLGQIIQLANYRLGIALAAPPATALPNALAK